MMITALEYRYNRVLLAVGAYIRPDGALWLLTGCMMPGGVFQTGGTTYASLKAQSEARANVHAPELSARVGRNHRMRCLEQDEKRQSERRKATLVLVLRFLIDNG